MSLETGNARLFLLSFQSPDCTHATGPFKAVNPTCSTHRVCLGHETMNTKGETRRNDSQNMFERPRSRKDTCRHADSRGATRCSFNDHLHAYTARPSSRTPACVMEGKHDCDEQTVRAVAWGIKPELSLDTLSKPPGRGSCTGDLTGGSP